MCKRILLGLLVLVFCVLSTPLGYADATYAELPVVMYHQLTMDESRAGDYVLTVPQFERDLIYLRENGYTAVTTSQLTAWCEGQYKLPEKPVIITLDDGYESASVYAQPLLEKYGMTAVASIIGTVTTQYTVQPDHTLHYSHLDWETVRRLDRGNVFEVQCHTYDMHKLAPRPGCAPMPGESPEEYRTALTTDLHQFQLQFFACTGHASTALALPFGFYSAQTLRIAREMGFEVIFTSTETVNVLTGKADELLSLGRFNRPSGPSSEEFFSKWVSE